MSILRTAQLFNVASRGLSTSGLRFLFKYPEDLPPQDKVRTGLEKRQYEAILAGDDDPFCINGITRGPGTKDKPTLVPSAYDSRIVGCICDDDTFAIQYMWLHKGTPKRCLCGHWYQLCYKAPI